jgi:hypothetical protein
MTALSEERKKVIVSYSHSDAEWLKRLQIHLKDLERNGLVELWDDTKISHGATWRAEISAALASARVAILLISADFIASDFIAENELPPLLAAAEIKGLTILPLIISPSRFEQVESLSRFQPVNPPNKPLIGLPRSDQESYLVKLSEDVLRAATKGPTNHLQPQSIISSSPDNKSETNLASPRQPREKVGRRAFLGTIIAALITVAGSIIVAFINGWFSSDRPGSAPKTDVYRVRVTVIDQQQTPVDGAKVWSSIGGEALTVAGGAQFVIPASTVPQNRTVTIFARHDSTSTTGKIELLLNNDYNPATTIQLKIVAAKVRGQIVDARGNAISGASVSVIGYGHEAVITSADGSFELDAHAPINQQVQLHVEKVRFKSVNQWHPAGESPATVILEQ